MKVRLTIVPRVRIPKRDRETEVCPICDREFAKADMRYSDPRFHVEDDEHEWLCDECYGPGPLMGECEGKS